VEGLGWEAGVGWMSEWCFAVLQSQSQSRALLHVSSHGESVLPWKNNKRLLIE
jgi:hypothetical protein